MNQTDAQDTIEQEDTAGEALIIEVDFGDVPKEFQIGIRDLYASAGEELPES